MAVVKTASDTDAETRCEGNTGTSEESCAGRSTTREAGADADDRAAELRRGDQHPPADFSR
jgi:hypothetical protein